VSVELEWRFGNEPPEDSPQEGQPRRSPRWRTWLALGVTALLLAGGGLYVWWRARGNALAAVEAEVQAVAELEMRALVDGDVDLYLSLQDDADPAWLSAQDACMAREACLPPPLPGLSVTTAVSVAAVRVVADTARAEVVRLAELAEGEVAPFRAVRFYRRSADGRWLHTGVDRSYTGHVLIFVGDWVEVTSFATDREWVAPIAFGLEELTEDFCRLVSCRQGTPMTLTFTDTLDAAVEPTGVLPAPFVVGVPGDEVAHAAWDAALRESFFNRLVARELGRPPGDVRSGELFRARLREWLRAELGLREVLAPDIDLVSAALDTAEWIPLGTVWTSVPPEGDARRSLAEAEVDLFIAFVDEEYGPSAVADLFRTAHDADDLLATVVWETLDETWMVLEARYETYIREERAR